MFFELTILTAYSLHHLHNEQLFLEFKKSEYLILSCIKCCNEYTSPFIQVTEGEVNVDNDELFDGVILKLIKG